jgi:hypothetical protein
VRFMVCALFQRMQPNTIAIRGSIEHGQSSGI